MKVYVSELPKSCEKCKFYEYEIEHNGEWGIEKHRHICKINGSLIQGICPLQSLSDYTKQVRKEVCESIKEQVLKHFNVKSEEEYEKSLSLLDALFTADVVFEILDQIQGE